VGRKLYEQDDSDLRETGDAVELCVQYGESRMQLRHR